jgi:hypothetical protein
MAILFLPELAISCLFEAVAKLAVRPRSSSESADAARWPSIVRALYSTCGGSQQAFEISSDLHV